jgi:hypothetical protein
VTQIGLDGHETPHPVRRPTPLSRRQREVLAYVRVTYPVRPLDVGKLMHAGRDRPCRECTRMGLHCRHASSDGYDALRRLERRGLVVRERRGFWCPTVAVEDWPGP